MKAIIVTCVLAFSGLAAVAVSGAEGRSALWMTFDRGLDYSRQIRTAQAARGWSVVEEDAVSGNRLLRVDYRFDAPGQGSLLVFDLVPTTLEKIRLRVRVSRAAGGPLRVGLSANSVGGGGYVAPDVLVPANGKWTTLEMDLSGQLSGIYANGKRVQQERISAEEIRKLALERIIVNVRLPAGADARAGGEFYVDFDLLEGFPPDDSE
ncbi:hypothetical protein H5P28_06450 [Ruficoccus amylovorans]|uniref:CBM11 domain-containing protein n=1 Tax=Ruficoccus amylovorans TaxID=1804625 RepID=A0A842HCV4_9BACT|nr:hypothetical protein [Ruficoccus amylovorans]MBC2593898.1 hypothetical protein [Ruficoccus amylovorans]